MDKQEATPISHAWLWRVLVQFLASFSWIEDVMASELCIGDAPTELAEVSVDKLASLDDESFLEVSSVAIR